jgi:hypothetical protein
MVLANMKLKKVMVALSRGVLIAWAAAQHGACEHETEKGDGCGTVLQRVFGV